MSGLGHHKIWPWSIWNRKGQGNVLEMIAAKPPPLPIFTK